MDDRDLEEILRRYLPRGPSSSLRDAVLAREPQSQRVWPWAVAAAALLAATVGLWRAADRLRPTAADRPLPVSASWVEAQPVGPAELDLVLEQMALVSAIQQRDVPSAPEPIPWR
jgi:hypothetical protein